MDRVTQVSETVRIEAGPPIKRSTATKNTLSNDVTASHYVKGGRDAFGKTIEIGKQFHYVDWKCGEEDYVFTLYQLRDDAGHIAEAEFDDDGNRVARYQIVDRYATHDAALEAAQKL